jgi:hypothetical protein
MRRSRSNQHDKDERVTRQRLCGGVLVLLVLLLLGIPSVLLLAPTRVALACPPPGIYIMCALRTVHFWETAWWTGHTSYFNGNADWIGVGLLLGSIALGAALIAVVQICGMAIPTRTNTRFRLRRAVKAAASQASTERSSKPVPLSPRRSAMRRGGMVD